MKLENLSLASIAAVVFTLILGFALIQINANAIATVTQGGGGGGTCGVYVAISPVTTLKFPSSNSETLVVPYVTELIFYGVEFPNGITFGPNFNAIIQLEYWDGVQNIGVWNGSYSADPPLAFNFKPGEIYDIDNSIYTQNLPIFAPNVPSYTSIYNGNTYLDVINANSTAAGEFVTLQVLQKVTCPS